MADYLIVYVVKYMYTTFYDVDSNEIVVETKVLTLINNVRIKVLSCLTHGDPNYKFTPRAAAPRRR